MRQTKVIRYRISYQYSEIAIFPFHAFPSPIIISCSTTASLTQACSLIQLHILVTTHVYGPREATKAF